MQPGIYAIGIEKTKPPSADHIGSVVFRVEALCGAPGGGNTSEHLSFVTIDSYGDSGKCDIAPLLSTLGDADIVFVLAGLDENDDILLGRICGAIFEDSIRTFLVLRDAPEATKAGVTGNVPKASVDGVIVLGASSLDTSSTTLSCDNRDPQALGYLLPPVIRAIADVIIRPSCVGIDLVDVLDLLCGKLTRFGTGSAHSGNRPIIATEQAVASLTDQGINLSEIDDVLCNLNGPSSLCMDDFDSICHYLHTRFDDDITWFVPIFDDHLGDNIVVNLMATLRVSGCTIPGWIDICDRVKRTHHIVRPSMSFCFDDK